MSSLSELEKKMADLNSNIESIRDERNKISIEFNKASDLLIGLKKTRRDLMDKIANEKRIIDADEKKKTKEKNGKSKNGE